MVLEEVYFYTSTPQHISPFMKETLTRFLVFRSQQDANFKYLLPA